MEPKQRRVGDMGAHHEERASMPAPPPRPRDDFLDPAANARSAAEIVAFGIPLPRLDPLLVWMSALCAATFIWAPPYDGPYGEPAHPFSWVIIAGSAATVWWSLAKSFKARRPAAWEAYVIATVLAPLAILFSVALVATALARLMYGAFSFASWF